MTTKPVYGLPEDIVCIKKPLTMERPPYCLVEKAHVIQGTHISPKAKESHEGQQREVRTNDDNQNPAFLNGS